MVEKDISDQQKGNTVLLLHVCVPMVAAGPGGPSIPMPGCKWWGVKQLLQPPCSAWLITVSLLCDFSVFLVATGTTHGQCGKFWPSRLQ